MSMQGRKRSLCDFLGEDKWVISHMMHRRTLMQRFLKDLDSKPDPYRFPSNLVLACNEATKHSASLAATGQKIAAPSVPEQEIAAPEAAQDIAAAAAAAIAAPAVQEQEITMRIEYSPAIMQQINEFTLFLESSNAKQPSNTETCSFEDLEVNVDDFLHADLCGRPQSSGCLDVEE